MKKIYLLSTMLLIALALLTQNTNAQVSVWDGTYAPWTNGTGTESDPFLIENAQQLAYLTYRVNNGLDAGGGHISNHNLYYKLMTDVNLNGSQNFQWTPIGNYVDATNYYCFGGHFDGNNHTVSGMYINCSLKRVGFFGYTDGATIQNLSVSGDTIATTGEYAGGIVGYAYQTTIKGCNNSCGVSSSYNNSNSYSGGIAGYSNSNVAISNCYNTGNVSSSSYYYYSFSGGIAGCCSNSNVTITNCYNTGNVSSSSYNNSNSYSGGIAGCSYSNSNGTITNCYNTGNVSSSSFDYSYSGGIAGYLGSNVTITNCYNTGNISSSSFDYSYSGGIAGCLGSNVTISNCYNTGNVSSSSNSHSYFGGISGYNNTDNVTIANCYYKEDCGGNNTYGGLPMSSAAMQTADFVVFLNNGTCAWEQDIQPYSNGGYPTLTMLFLSANTLNAANVTQSHSTLQGSISVENDVVLSSGFLYKSSTSSNYSQIICSSVNDTLSYTLSGLLPATSYTYKTFLYTAGCDTTFGDNRSFTTASVSATTSNYASNITQTQATISGSFVIGDANMSAQGFEYWRNGDTTVYTVNISGGGEFSENLSDLIPNTQYSFRAFCSATGCEMVYGNTRYFTTLNVSVTTNPATDLTESSAILNGTMNMGDATVTARGFEYRESGTTNYSTVYSTDTTDAFSATLYNLPVNTSYEYRTFVSIAENTEPYYGNTQSFEVSWLNADTIYIYDEDMLRWVSTSCNNGATFEGKYVKLMNNIVLTLNQPNNMTSIGAYPTRPFKGTFDGNGMTITNLYIDQPNTEYQGFFGYTLNANLYEVGLVNITASGRNYTGGMVAYAANTYMRDCYVNGGSLFALNYCGGLVGYQQSGTNSIISGCYNTCTVSGNHYVGGLVGFSNYATVRNSYVAASVAGQGNGIGAIIGGANEVLMYNCYFSSNITGQTYAIGENNFKDNEGMTDEEMRASAFVATLNQGLVVPVWKSDYSTPINNGFPILMWQYSNSESCEGPTNLSHSINGNNVTLTWEGGENATYFIVEYGSGENVHSENVSTRQYTIHDMPVGSYFWRVKSVCSFGESNFVSGNTIVTSINNYGTEHCLHIYPNPTQDLLNIQCSAVGNNTEVQVFDIYGKLLQIVPVEAETTQIDMTRYSTGMYILKAVINGKVSENHKVIKK